MFFNILQNMRLRHSLLIFDNEIQGLFHCEFCYLVANFDNVETRGYGDSSV